MKDDGGVVKGARMRVKIDDKWCVQFYEDDIVLLADSGVEL